jgi:predicted outer membrane repeat protein
VGAYGGGLYGHGDVTLVDTVVSNNTASFEGGGVYGRGNLVMEGSTISGNSGDSGGGAWVKGDISITTSTFDNNTSSANCGGALYAATDNGTITITNSTFSNNTSTDCHGGAIDINRNGNMVVIANTTITGNSALAGGGLHANSGNNVSLFMDTISGNTATSTDALYSGGGVHFYGGLTRPVMLTMVGTIVSGNSAVAGPADFGVGNSTTGLYSITINDSLIGDVDSRLTVTGSGNVISTSPGLSALADNGGPTKTMALLSTSPAVDAGPNPVPTAPGWVPIFDQRGAGFARVVGTKSDIGAFEIQATPAPTTTTTVASDEPVAPAFTG